MSLSAEGARKRRKIAESGAQSSVRSTLRLVAGANIPDAIERHILSYLSLHECGDCATLSKDMLALLESFFRATTAVCDVGSAELWQWRFVFQLSRRLRTIEIRAGYQVSLRILLPRLVLLNKGSLTHILVPTSLASRSLSEMAAECPELRVLSCVGARMLDAASFSEFVRSLVRRCPLLEQLDLTACTDLMSPSRDTANEALFQLIFDKARCLRQLQLPVVSTAALRTLGNLNALTSLTLELPRNLLDACDALGVLAPHFRALQRLEHVTVDLGRDEGKLPSVFHAQAWEFPALRSLVLFDWARQGITPAFTAPQLRSFDGNLSLTVSSSLSNGSPLLESLRLMNARPDLPLLFDGFCDALRSGAWPRLSTLMVNFPLPSRVLSDLVHSGAPSLADLRLMLPHRTEPMLARQLLLLLPRLRLVRLSSDPVADGRSDSRYDVQLRLLETADLNEVKELAELRLCVISRASLSGLRFLRLRMLTVDPPCGDILQLIEACPILEEFTLTDNRRQLLRLAGVQLTVLRDTKARELASWVPLQTNTRDSENVEAAEAKRQKIPIAALVVSQQVHPEPLLFGGGAAFKYEIGAVDADDSEEQPVRVFRQRVESLLRR